MPTWRGDNQVSPSSLRIRGQISAAQILNKPTLPVIATSAVAGLVKSNTTGTTADRDYNVQVNNDGTMKVNVP